MAGLTPIRGVWATVLLSVTDSGPDIEAIGPQVAALARAGVDGIYCNGTATEFHCQTEAQFRAVSVATATAARAAGLPYQIGAPHPLAPDALDRIGFAAGLEPRAIQVILPDWTAVTPQVARRFLDAAAAAARGVPLVLYNPPHAKTVLAPGVLAELAATVPTLEGLKCAGGDAAWYDAMRPVLERLSVFVPGHFYASGTAQGAHGAYSNMACLDPAATARWAAQCRTDPAAAMDLETRIAAFIAEALAPLIAAGYPGHACDKAMAAAGGWTRIASRMMWPCDSVDDAGVARIRDAARRHIPEFAV